ncbi:MAG: hypothetical protein ACPLPW_08295, partial [bacterium]
PYSYCKNNPVSMVDPSGWMYMYRASVLGGEAGTWKDALEYFVNLNPDNPAVIIGYSYILSNITIPNLLDLTDTLVSPYTGVRQKIVTAALFFLGMEAAGIFPEEDPYNCCANFVSLVLRMAGVFGKNENYRYIGDLGDGGLLDRLYELGNHQSVPFLPGDIVIFHKGGGLHHAGIYIGGIYTGSPMFIGSNNQIIGGEIGPQLIDIKNLSNFPWCKWKWTCFWNKAW